MGPIKGERVTEEIKKDIMAVIVESKINGVSISQSCKLLQIEERRTRRWFLKPVLADIKPGPVHAPHALLLEERSAILVAAKDDQYVDDSHRILTAKCVDAGLIAVSASTVYNVMRAEGLTTDRNGRSHRNGNSHKPDRPELTGPNQRWCWDISYLMTLVSGSFLYLYVLLDEYSRKVVAFRVSWRIINAEGKELIDQGIQSEGLNQEQVAKLVLFNDRGTQMKAKPFKRFLADLGISQKFARPRTPNDNPFVESLFATTKGALEYPGKFTDDVEAFKYFTKYFDHYNNVRLHGKIGYVTPSQRHNGEDKAILDLRNARLVGARKIRLEKNRRVVELAKVKNQIPSCSNEICLIERSA